MSEPQPLDPAEPPPPKKKRVLVVAAPGTDGEETLAMFLEHFIADKIDVVSATSFEEAAELLFPKFDEVEAEAHMRTVGLPTGAYYKIGKSRFGHHIHVFEEGGERMDLAKHFGIGFAVDMLEKRCQLAPFDTLITEELIALKSVPKSPQTYLGLGLIALAQMAGVPRIGILIPKGGQDVRHFLGDIRCGERKLVLSFRHADWKFVSRELLGV